MRSTNSVARAQIASCPRSVSGTVLAWARHGMLFGVYKRLPERLRAIVSRLAWRGAWRELKFPALPQVLPDSGESPEAIKIDRPAAVNMFGFFGGQFGLGQGARLYASALRAAGIAVATVDIDLGLPHARQGLLASASANPTQDAIDIVLVNPDYLEEALRFVEDVGPARRLRIACWHWEFDRLPRAWVSAASDVDAIMVSSRFVEQAVAAAVEKPVFRVPLPLGEGVDSGLDREAFGLSVSAYIFLVSFDFHSSVHRKNPKDAVAAFQRAFPEGNENVQLLVKSSNGEHYPSQLADLVDTGRRDARILFRNQVLDPAHMRALQRCCDAYVSLHRAEGFGLGLAECMALGKPVVATAWSGNLDFMNSQNSCLVDALPVQVQPGEYPFAEESFMWAQPDIEQAGYWMRKLANDREFGETVGRFAAEDVREQLSPRCITELFVEQLTALNNPSALAGMLGDLPR